MRGLSHRAAVIAVLASEDASFVNGVNLPVDGGVSASNGQPTLVRVFSTPTGPWYEAA